MHMTELNRGSLDKCTHSVGVRQIRLACGLVLFAYLLSHFINHALGNISLDALATGVRYHTAFWKSLPIATVFYAAAAAHAGLGIWALYQRRQFHWKAIEPIQLVLGLSIPALIITHLAGVRIDDVLFQHQKLYPQVFYSYWIVWPYKMWLMFIVLIGYVGLIGFVLVARSVRTLNERRGGMINLSYGNGRMVRVPKGLSVLEASLRNNVPHASICGGRARCSTCRIRVVGDC